MNPQIIAFRVMLGLVGFAAVVAFGATVWHFTPIIGSGAAQHRLEVSRDEWKSDAEKWQKASAGWESSYRQSERLRGQEQATAVAAATSAIQQCAARVSEARASARVIERIVTKEPTYDQNRCPVRELVPADSLRDALAPRPRAD